MSSSYLRWINFNGGGDGGAPGLGAEATYGGIKAPAGATSIAINTGPSDGHIKGPHGPEFLFIIWKEIDWSLLPFKIYILFYIIKKLIMMIIIIIFRMI